MPHALVLVTERVREEPARTPQTVLERGLRLAEVLVELAVGELRKMPVRERVRLDAYASGRELLNPVPGHGQQLVPRLVRELRHRQRRTGVGETRADEDRHRHTEPLELRENAVGAAEGVVEGDVQETAASGDGVDERRGPVPQAQEQLDLPQDPSRRQRERVRPRVRGGVVAEDERVAGYVVCRRAGKRITSRIVSRPVSTIASRSTPTPQPPFGAIPYDIAST